MSSDLLFKTWPCLSMALFAAGMVFRYSRSQKMVVGEKRFHMTKSIGQILGQTVAVAAMCFLYAGPAAANANPPAAPVTGNDVPKHEERVSDAMPALSVRGARDRLADFFERTGGGARVIPASEVWESLDQGAMKYLVVDVRSAEDFAKGHVPGAVHMPLQTLFRQAKLTAYLLSCEERKSWESDPCKKTNLKLAQGHEQLPRLKRKSRLCPQ